MQNTTLSLQTLCDTYTHVTFYNSHVMTTVHIIRCLPQVDSIKCPTFPSCRWPELLGCMVCGGLPVKSSSSYILYLIPSHLIDCRGKYLYVGGCWGLDIWYRKDVSTVYTLSWCRYQLGALIAFYKCVNLHFTMLMY